MLKLTLSIGAKDLTGEAIWKKGKNVKADIIKNILPCWCRHVGPTGELPSGTTLEDMLKAVLEDLDAVHHLPKDQLAQLSDTLPGSQSLIVDNAYDQELHPDEIHHHHDHHPPHSTINIHPPVQVETTIFAAPSGWRPLNWAGFLMYGAPAEQLYGRDVEPDFDFKGIGNGPVVVNATGSSSCSSAGQLDAGGGHFSKGRAAQRDKMRAASDTGERDAEQTFQKRER